MFIDKLITIQGMIIRSGSIIPDLRRAFFRCLVCKHTVTRDMDRNVIDVRWTLDVWYLLFLGTSTVSKL